MRCCKDQLVTFLASMKFPPLKFIGNSSRENCSDRSSKPFVTRKPLLPYFHHNAEWTLWKPNAVNVNVYTLDLPSGWCDHQVWLWRLMRCFLCQASYDIIDEWRVHFQLITWTGGGNALKKPTLEELLQNASRGVCYIWLMAKTDYTCL